MIGITKTTSLGTVPGIILEPRACYRRAAPVAADWTRVLIGAFVSLVGTSGDNVDCASEVIPYNNFRDQFSFGIASGPGAPGIAGHRFIGVGRQVTGAWTAPYWDAPNTAWKLLGNSVALNSCIADGTSILLGGGNAYIAPHHKAPSAETLFAAFIGVDITLSPTGVAVKVAPTAYSSPYGITDVSEAALLRTMFTANYASNSLLTGGWWSGGGGSGCTDFFLRGPYYGARWRILAKRVEQLA